MAKKNLKKSPYACIINPEKAFVDTITKELGTSVKSIRQNLKKMKIKGDRSEVGSCPLANYLQARGFDEVSVDGDVEVYNIGGASESFHFSLPQAFHDFVSQFDDGKFPELDEKPDSDRV